ncbi:MAG: hypothetical protein ACYTXE_45225 [Nostoc sp.]
MGAKSKNYVWGFYPPPNFKKLFPSPQSPVPKRRGVEKMQQKNNQWANFSPDKNGQWVDWHDLYLHLT